MKFYTAFILLFISLSGWAKDDCQPNEVRLLAEYVGTYYQKYDVSLNIQELKSAIKACNYTYRDLGISPDFYTDMERESYKQAMNRARVDLEHFAKTGRVNGFEKEFLDYAKKAGYKDGFFDSYLKSIRKKSEDSYAREKASCTPVDLREELGPVRDQDSIGWCYAFAAADLLSYKLKQRISAADLATTYNKDFFTDISRKYLNRTEDTFEGGLTDEALNKGLKKGLCLEKDFPSEDGLRFDRKLHTIDRMGREQIDSKNKDCDVLYESSRHMFPNVSVSGLREILELSTKEDFINTMADRSCKERIKTDLKITSKTAENLELGQIIDAQLAKNNPVSLSFDASGLFNRRNYEGISWHASVIAGRRFDEATGQCQYLLRNSWGRSCGVYDSSYECREGNIWIPKADLIKRGRKAVYVE